ncbi:G-type lectin S-receptor-like serine/threonine-protein kinase At4g27290 [Ziziphus jujuba]|uniref:Receptor-like serine/threonine-protein kinase n=1 Tax=Ziziphus jujuba TaxID=326968 RepID=A0ABM3IBQ8_ZIZJJ|nr:G-type lectin S-receptor-like serine/threonine-protein kinase At4g27290 [Ziziphus jujuba]
METCHLFPIIFFAFVLLQFLLKSCSTNSILDTMTPTQSITDIHGQTLVSKGQIFELGFFSPGISNKRYLGIWYKNTPDVIVWVANRNNPLTDSNGTLIITNHGNLLLLNQAINTIWSSNSSMVTNNPVAKLLDSGILVVGDQTRMDSNNNHDSEHDVVYYAWQSFDYPTDTFLAGMKIGWNFKTGLERYLTSWKSQDDPSTGDSTVRMKIKGLPQLIIARGTKIKLRSGPWDGFRFSTSPNTLTNPVFNSTLISNDEELYFTYRTDSNAVTTRGKVNHLGLLDRFILHNGSTNWSVMYTAPYERCDNYGYCGANGFCRINKDPICECLDGFVPKSDEEWKMMNWAGGCVRKSPLEYCKSGDGFVKLAGVKYPDFLEFWSDESMSLDECKEVCLRNCSCTAYANSDIERRSGCMVWFGDLIDVRELRPKISDPDEIYLRLPASELKSIHDGKRKRRLKTIIIVSVITSSICILALVWWIFWNKRRSTLRVQKTGDKEDVELPLYDLATIASATNNFSSECMIGSGGFGPVYKGNLITGQEIAVKRLSQNSGQGIKEFKNEVELIAKLQHRNLVALLGCCIQGEERILIYEYMPNRSLDHFIFDNKRSTILKWKKLFDIVMGIARGLLYLHRDSKLQIIHRDLKASNILLDSNLNPKISDFGLARIFGDDDEKEARTRRVVGTYGYMSPEYAIDGKFSVKSDVFSFGVLLIEIISRKKNRRFSHPDHHHNLLGHAWLLWNEGKALDLMDVSLNDSSIEYSQVVRCIQVGLLCVQKFPHDRPTMSSIVYMLENEGATLSRPKQPGFFMERSSNDEGLTVSKNVEPSYSRNEVTVSMTMMNGR